MEVEDKFVEWEDMVVEEEIVNMMMTREMEKKRRKR